MPSFAEEEFQCQVSFAETATAADPTTSPPNPVGSIGALGALGGRSYRGVVTRVSPLPGAAGAAAGIYFLETDYDVAMADLDYTIGVVGAGAVLKVGDLIRVGSLIDGAGRTRAVYRIRVALAGTGAPADTVGSLVTITMKRVDPNLR